MLMQVFIPTKLLKLSSIARQVHSDLLLSILFSLLPYLYLADLLMFRLQLTQSLPGQLQLVFNFLQLTLSLAS